MWAEGAETFFCYFYASRGFQSERFYVMWSMQFIIGLSRESLHLLDIKSSMCFHEHNHDMCGFGGLHMSFTWVRLAGEENCERQKIKVAQWDLLENLFEIFLLFPHAPQISLVTLR